MIAASRLSPSCSFFVDGLGTSECLSFVRSGATADGGSLSLDELRPATAERLALLRCGATDGTDLFPLDECEAATAERLTFAGCGGTGDAGSFRDVINRITYLREFVSQYFIVLYFSPNACFDCIARLPRNLTI